MKNLLIILISFLLLSSPLFGQSKPLGVVLPATVMGNVSNSRKQILLNTLDEKLSQYFNFQNTVQSGSGELEVSSDVFQLQIIEEDGNIQLSLRWMSGDDRKIETKLCNRCKTNQLNDELKELIEKLVMSKKVSGLLYLWKTPSGSQWKSFGDEKVQLKFEGEIFNKKPHGFGNLYYPLRKGTQRRLRATGEWKNGKQWNTKVKENTKYGITIEKYKNGELILRQGTLYEPEKGGKWVLERVNDSDNRYTGNIVNGVPNGMGILYFSNGNKFDGIFKDGIYEGFGTFEFRGGGSCGYKWRRGRPWNVKCYDKGGNNVIQEFVNGVEQK